MAQTFTPIVTLEVTSTQAFIALNNLPTNYADLYLTISGFSAVTGDDLAMIQFNNELGSTINTCQSYTYITSGTSTVTATDRAASTAVAIGNIHLTSAGYPGLGEAYIFNFQNTTRWKNVLAKFGSGIRAGLANGYGGIVWRNTAPITAINLRTVNGYGFGVGTIVNLYGIAEA
jgi:hypothetical protein